jgi:hypothetical protein
MFHQKHLIYKQLLKHVSSTLNKNLFKRNYLAVLNANNHIRFVTFEREGWLSVT